MKRGSVFEFLLILLSILIFGYFLYSFIFGNKKLMLPVMSLISFILIVYQAIKLTLTIKRSDNQSKVCIAKLSLIRVIIAAVMLIILIPIGFIYFA